MGGKREFGRGRVRIFGGRGNFGASHFVQLPGGCIRANDTAPCRFRLFTHYV